MGFPQTIGQAMQCPMYAITKCLAYRKAKDSQKLPSIYLLLTCLLYPLWITTITHTGDVVHMALRTFYSVIPLLFPDLLNLRLLHQLLILRLLIGTDMTNFC